MHLRVNSQGTQLTYNTPFYAQDIPNFRGPNILQKSTVLRPCQKCSHPILYGTQKHNRRYKKEVTIGVGVQRGRKLFLFQRYAQNGSSRAHIQSLSFGARNLLRKNPDKRFCQRRKLIVTWVLKYLAHLPPYFRCG